METNNKLREAVVLALSLLDSKEGVPYKTVSQKDLDFMKSALAEPVRNCDLYDSADDARAAWICLNLGVIKRYSDFEDWLFDYAKESEEAK